MKISNKISFQSYNWYYTGGSLNHVRLNGWDVLLFPFMEDLGYF